jgi:hypothetical protein
MVVEIPFIHINKTQELGVTGTHINAWFTFVVLAIEVTHGGAPKDSTVSWINEDTTLL